MRLSEMHKQFLHTIITQLPPYIKEYPSDQQEILNEFLNILKYYYEADNNRKQLSKRILQYTQRYTAEYSTIYIKYSFLWFSVAFFANANLKLSLAEYDGRSFYMYLAKPFRRNSYSEGAFLLIKNKIPLTDLKWEILQLKSINIQLNLTSEQLIALKTVYKTINELGIYTLNSHRLKEVIAGETPQFSNKRDLANFFKLLGSQWDLWFFTPAFDLKYLYIHFKLPKKIPLMKIIDFQYSENRTLCSSRIHRVPGSSNEYSGYLVIPKPFFEDLKLFLKENESKGKISLQKMDKVITERVSFSLALYNHGKGWQASPPASSSPQESFFYITPEFNRNWNYRQFPDPTTLIQFYCEHTPSYSFENLPLDPVPKKRLNVQRTITEIGLLKFLFEKNVCTLAFGSSRMLYNYSPSLFEIECPTSLLKDINRIISWIPYARVFILEKNIILWAFLTSKAVEVLEKKNGCKVRQIISHHRAQNPQSTWYDFTKLTWYPPIILAS